jgi:hypothetical protein
MKRQYGREKVGGRGVTLGVGVDERDGEKSGRGAAAS